MVLDSLAQRQDQLADNINVLAAGLTELSQQQQQQQQISAKALPLAAAAAPGGVSMIPWL
jgi:hypothetical protein